MQESAALNSVATPGITPLEAVQARILGCLIEKEATTPEAYPLTINAIVAACNQKTSREPVMHLVPGAVAHALRSMEETGLVKLAPASQRALRYEHRFDAMYGVTGRQRAVLCLLLLRGPQTLGELLTRSQRITEFHSDDEVRDTLERLITRDPPLAVDLGRAPGQRENRYMHLLCGHVDASQFVSAAPAQSTPAPMPERDDDLYQRVERLEAELASLRRDLDELR
ncbi:MAG: DUF480 domain-containing protein [Xanthomonadales bacterium]|nr:DUF480 domain-containing protein [Xanthomonadales bacterium]